MTSTWWETVAQWEFLAFMISWVITSGIKIAAVLLKQFLQAFEVLLYGDITHGAQLIQGD